MKKAILTAIFIIINTVSINALDFMDYIASYFNYSYSKEFGGNDIRSDSIGLELLFEDDALHCFGSNLKFSGSNTTIRLHYLIMPVLGDWSADDVFFGLSFGVGTNISFNMSKNVFGIGPQINMEILLILIFKISVTYRYNIYFTADNTSEFELTIGIMNLLIR